VEFILTITKHKPIHHIGGGKLIGTDRHGM
jgi:hypothetical protein